jgi:glycerol kinase
MPELLLAIDAGTTNLRVCLFNPAGEMLGQATSPVRSHSPQPGLVEQDAGRIWRMTLTTIARALAAAGRTAADLAAVGVTSQRTSAVCWDRTTGRPLTPLVVWSDLRGTDRARALQAAGYPVAPQQAAAKLEAMIAGVPGAASLARRGRLAWGNIDAFLIWKLTGGAVHATDRSQAWPTGYLDMATFGWSASLLALQELDERVFPTLVDTWGTLGVTSTAVLGAQVPIAAVIADQQSALIGQGCEAAGEAKVTFGTSATLDVSSGGAFVYCGPTTPPFVLSSTGGETRFCLEGMVYSAGSAVDWLRRSFGLGDHARFARLAEAAPDSQGVYFLPALQGLGAPHGDAARRGVIGGLSTASGPSHLARAAIEGVAFRVREIFLHIYGATDLPRPEVLRADGGLSASTALMQAQADLLGMPVARHALREATAAGAAICAGRGIGLLDSSAAFVRHDRTFEPRISADEASARFAVWKGHVYGRAG